MRLDRAATIVIDRLPQWFRSATSSHRVPVLMYHSVSEDAESGVHPYYRLTVSPRRFAEQMQWLAANDYSVIGLDAAAAPPRCAGDRQVVVTFDDGFVDFLTAAWPVLEARGFTATVFLPTGFIGDTRQAFNNRECMTWSEVRDLSRRGVSFGSHTVTHPVLRDMPWSDIRKELRDSKLQIESVLSTTVQAFAYPFAFPQHPGFVSRFCDELRLQGYTFGVTTMVGRFAEGDELLCMRRLPLNQADDLALFRAKVKGSYDWMGGVQGAWKRYRPLRSAKTLLE
jgi:peptidoglycan/xylan/chitin deacetylase (PgdA/CDA1 family)